ncbi:hypothetical protein [Fuchsiella alkaliacetigena]|uniref:hypothetical protein n=1 Tax=Fuchsiella alkaliacetigena TaxID=957042 RepID=UPI00200B0077|nr:hypothetical protein [Fuchsiella alkaliacetigena]MCK8825020.1 hypothetical protein [Fuchsiella alkaliacetigena]
MTSKLLVLIVVLALGIGYAVGYYFGKQDGVTKGILVSPIFLRKESLKEGYCVLCTEDKSSKDCRERIKRCRSNDIDYI